MGQSPSSSAGFVFQHNILYEPPTPSPPPPAKNRRRRFMTSSVGRAPRLLVQPETKTSVFHLTCKPQLSIFIGDEIKKSNEVIGPGLIKANFYLKTIDEWSTYNLNSHVLNIVSTYSEDVKFDDLTVNLISEFESAENAFRQYLNRIKDLYQAYGTFLADGLITYQPLMTRLGLWQMLIDNNLHAQLSLADFDDLLCK